MADREHPELEGQWALILGASSGFGEAVALELARHGMHVLGVHLDRRATMPNVERIVAGIREHGSEAHFFNLNAADHDKRRDAVGKIDEILSGRGPRQVRILLHSLAFGALKPLVAGSPKESLTAAQIEMTLDVMASSLVYWVQDLAWRKLLGDGSRIYAMTSAGDFRCWPGYGAVSAAKAALEAYVRQIAFELAPLGVTANAIRAGVTDTPASRKIPGSEAMFDAVRRRNPGGRMTTPEDVAGALPALACSGTRWITGNVIGVDGGEEIVG